MVSLPLEVVPARTPWPWHSRTRVIAPFQKRLVEISFSNTIKNMFTRALIKICKKISWVIIYIVYL
jgi:hypothetical protein